MGKGKKGSTGRMDASKRTRSHAKKAPTWRRAIKAHNEMMKWMWKLAGREGELPQVAMEQNKR